MDVAISVKGSAKIVAAAFVVFILWDAETMVAVNIACCDECVMNALWAGRVFDELQDWCTGIGHQCVSK